jgi:hypothetical protein
LSPDVTGWKLGKPSGNSSASGWQEVLFRAIGGAGAAKICTIANVSVDTTIVVSHGSLILREDFQDGSESI